MVAFVQDFHTENAFSDTVLSVPAGGVALGSTLIFNIGLGSDSNTVTSVTDTKGNSYSVVLTQHGSGDNRTIVVAYGYMAAALTAADSITVDDAADDGSYVNASEFTGLAAASAFDKSASQRIDFDTDHTSGDTAAISQADELLFGAHMVMSTDAWTATGGFTLSQSDTVFGGASRVVTQYQIVSSVAAYASTGTTPGANTSLDAIATFEAESAPTGTGLAWVRAAVKDGLQDARSWHRRRSGIYVPDAPALLLPA